MDTPPPKIARIAGQRPSVWPPLQPNKDGTLRTESEIHALLEMNGITIPKDIEFHVGNREQFEGGSIDDLVHGHIETARYSGLDVDSSGFVHYKDFYHSVTGKMPCLLNPALLVSDEAILAVVIHELHEMMLFRELFAENHGKLSADYFRAESMPMNGHNFHSQAWSAADEFIRQRRSYEE